MKYTYDWSKLDAGWSVEGEKLQLAAAHGFKRWACWDIPVLEKVTGVPIGESTQSALDQLAKCRITAPDVATVTELRPRDEYDWSRLKGSGWRHAMVDNEYITDGTWCYWYSSENSEQLQTSCVFALGDAAKAQEQAFALVAKCRRDWRDEVKQACEGIDGLAELYLMVPSEYRLRASDSPHWFALAFKSDRTFGLIDGVQTLEWVLKLSLIIERLKKLGWREA